MKENNKIPQCIGFIMDGNRRWARGQSLEKLLGHTAGYKKAKEVIAWTKASGIKNLVLYTFSIENWGREKSEVDYLMSIIEKLFYEESDNFLKENIKVVVSGDKSMFSSKTKKTLLDLEEKTKNCDGMNLFLALSYGGRAEILNVVKEIVKNKEEKIDEQTFEKYLWTHPMPDPDLIVRTSGEMRLSGFLPWQSVYSELFFIETFWPDFSKEEFDKILNDFQNRKRRYGK